MRRDRDLALAFIVLWGCVMMIPRLCVWSLVLVGCVATAVDPDDVNNPGGSSEESLETRSQSVGECADGSEPVFPCYRDQDHDGRGAGSEVALCNCGVAAGTSRTSNDCDDSDASKYQQVSCYADHDGDGHGTGALSTTCGSTCAARGMLDRWADSDHTIENNTDCNDSNADQYQLLTCYTDADGDHFGDLSLGSTSVCAGLTCADGATNKSDSAGDCNDGNAAIHPFRSEVSSNGIDDDCTGFADEARADFSTVGNGNTDSGFTMKVTLNNASELAAATAGTLKAKIWYRKLESASGGYLSTAIAPVTIQTWFGKTYAQATLTGLDPLTVYEARLDFYKGAANTRIQPLSCSGTTGSSTPCSNSDAYYTITQPSSATDVVKMARYNFVLNALSEYFYFRSHPLGSWDDSLRDRFQLAERDSAYCSEFYATSTMPFLVDMNPCQARSDRPWCDTFETSTGEYTVSRIRDWFDAYGAASDFVTDTDLTARKPGDYLGVNPNAEYPLGQHSQMFLAYDASARTYWVVEGNGSDNIGFGSLRHTVNVKPYLLPTTDTWVQTMGSVSHSSMVER